jgi:hypothetical protein
VVKLVNHGLIRRRTSIPTAALALKRFEVGVLTATTEWIGGGSLSDVHVGMLLREVRSDLTIAIRDSVARLNFVDPYSGAGTVELHIIAASVDLAGAPSLDDAFHRIQIRLTEASSNLPQDWRSDDRIEEWCADDE